MSNATGMTIFILTAFIQAAVQLVVFMHARETEDSKSIFADSILRPIHCFSDRFRYTLMYDLGLEILT